MLHFGSHIPRRIETRLTTDTQRDFVRPMAELVAAGLVAKGVQPRDGWHTVCHSEGTCTCWDFVYRGPARAGGAEEARGRPDKLPQHAGGGRKEEAAEEG